MAKDDKFLEIILGILVIGISFLAGFMVGSKQMEEITKKQDCMSEFKFKPASEVTAGCIKYFK